jgi:hypothetical protein
MAKRKARNQTSSLIPDHKKSGIDPTSMCADGVRYTVGKISTRTTTLIQTSSQLEVWAKSYGPAKLRESNFSNFRTPLLRVPGQKGHLDVSLVEKRKEYYMGERGGFPRIRAVVNLMNPKSHVACPSTKGVAT